MKTTGTKHKLKVGKTSGTYMKEQLRKEWNKFVDTLPSRVGETPREVIFDWFLSHFPDLTDKGWEDWESEFDKLFTDYYKSSVDFYIKKKQAKNVKSFIRNLLLSQKREDEKTKEMTDIYVKGQLDGAQFGREEVKREIERMVEGMKINDDELGLGKEYDKALSDLLVKLKEI